MLCVQVVLSGQILLFIGFCLSSVPPTHECKRVCVKDEKPKTCVYNFTIEWYRTLSKACYDCPFNATDCFRPECVSGDGTAKAIITVNRQVPGPSIEVCAGDQVVVMVTNDMEDGSATSIHWHGLHQVGTPYSDGVGGVTQCNIGYKETFRYEFKADPVGTHWYHSHTGLQLADGLFGAIVIRQPLDLDPNSALYDTDDHVMVVGDWLPVTAITRYIDLMHDRFDIFLPQGLHVNGRGRNVDVPQIGNPGKTAKTPLEVFMVEAGKRYRFRVIGSSGNCPVQVSFEDHTLQVLAADGHPVKPRPVDVFIVQPGERYDFLLLADKPARNYWVRIIGAGDCNFNKVTTAAILRYAGAPDADPETEFMYSTYGKIFLNPLLRDGKKYLEIYGNNHTVINPDELEYAASNVNLTDDIVDQKHYISMEFNKNDNTKYNNKDLYPTSVLSSMKTHYTPVFDNITFLMPPIPVLSQPEDVDESWFCNRSSLGDSDRCLKDLCLCAHTLRFDVGQNVEWILVNEGKTLSLDHVVHLHGHSFHVLGIQKLTVSTTRDEIMRLDKEGQLRRNYVNPPLRDMVDVPRGGYAIIRFKADNPGFWLFHCHTDSHLAQGKAMLVKTGDYSDFPAIPNSFPRCGGMGFSNSKARPKPAQCPVNSGGLHLTNSIFAFVVFDMLLLVNVIL